MKLSAAKRSRRLLGRSVLPRHQAHKGSGGGGVHLGASQTGLLMKDFWIGP